MRKISFVLLILSITCSISASEDKNGINTLFAGHQHGFSVFGGPAFKLVFLNGKSQSFFGGGGAWVIGDNLTLGGSGHATIPDYEKNGYKYHFGYLGFEAGYFLFEKETVSLWPRMLIGPGYTYFNDSEETLNWYLVIEPGVDINMNVTGHTRATIGISYLAVSGDSINEKHLNGNEYSGFSMNFAIRFLL